MKKQNTYCDEMQKLILLENSGELTAAKAAELQEHLNNCRPCSEYRNDISVLTEKCRAALPGEMPSRQSVEYILGKADRRGKVVQFSRPWRFVPAAAAALALILGTYVAFYTPGNNDGESQTYAISDMNIILSLASDGSVDTTEDAPPATSEAGLQKLADNLLELQGFKIKEEEAADITEILLPTALQSRNSPAFPAKISV